MTEINKQDWIKVFTGLWLASLFYSILLLGFSFCVSPSMLDTGTFSWIPVCSAKANGGECFACGLSHSITSIGHGNFTEAAKFNPLGFPLITIASLNLLFGLYFFSIRAATVMERPLHSANPEPRVPTSVHSVFSTARVSKRIHDK